MVKRAGVQWPEPDKGGRVGCVITDAGQCSGFDADTQMAARGGPQRPL